MPLLRRTYSSFFSFFISIIEKNKLNLDSDTILVTAKAVKQKEEQVMRR